jgi:hypothetical protein
LQIYFPSFSRLKTEDPKLKCLFSETSLKIYCLLNRDTFQTWFNKFGKQQPQLYDILFVRVDSIAMQLGTMAQNSGVVSKINAKQAHKLKNDPRVIIVVRTIFLPTRELEDELFLVASTMRSLVSLLMVQIPTFKLPNSKRSPTPPQTKPLMETEKRKATP